MNILFLAGNINQVGGIEKYNQNFISCLKGERVKVVLVERNPGGIIQKISFTLRVFILALINRPDYVICTHLNFSPLCYFLNRLFGIKYSVSVYGIETMNIASEIFIKALKNADKIIYLFEATAENIVRQIPEAKSKIFNLPNSIDGDRFVIKKKSTELVSRFGLSASPVILTIGRMSTLDGDNKGYRRVVKAIPKVLESVPNAKYLLTGSGDDVSGVKKLINELGLSSSVILADAPTNEEIVDYYNLGDAFILPSKNEGFPPIVILEALACGVPIIGGNQKGAEKAMLDGELGVIVPADDVDKIGDAIVMMLKKEGEPGLFNKEHLRAKALEVYGLEAYKKQIKRFLDIIKK